MNRFLRRAGAAAGLATAVALLTAGVASAHPLGNFTINHYAGLRLSAHSIEVDAVIDMAEIPAFQQRQQLDRNGDGTVDAAEAASAREPLCRSLATSLRLIVAGGSMPLSLESAGLSFPQGSSGLSTLRLVCEFDAAVPPGIAGQTVSFEDTSFAGRIGWREIVVQGDSMSIASLDGRTIPASSVSARLTSYPRSLLSAPLAESSVEFIASPGGAPLGLFHAPDAAPLGGIVGGGARPDSQTIAPIGGSVPGGVAESVGGLIQARDLTPLVLMASILAAMVLGAAHALSPGHGKTVMAAYLVGTRGSVWQAVALGLIVTASHTAGVLVLAVVVLEASSVVPPERLYPVLSVIAGLTVVMIGLYLVSNRIRESAVVRRRLSRSRGHDPAHDHDHDHDHSHDLAHDHDHDHDHSHDLAHDHGHGHAHYAERDHVHGVGPFRRTHSHVPPTPSTEARATLRWSSLAALGLAGGLVPSASALLLLLGAIASGRAAYGIVLVLAFGLGMAVVLVGVGLVLVLASRATSRLDLGTPGRLAAKLVPAVTALAVLAGGLLLTYQALHPAL